MAAGSRSNASTRPSGPSAPRMSAVCPPRPNVASIYRPSARIASASNASPASTGTCASNSLTPSQAAVSPPPFSQAPLPWAEAAARSFHPTPKPDRLTTSPKPESQSERVEFRRQTGLGRLVGEPQGATLVPARFVPQLATVALADQHAAALEVREFAQLRRQQQAAVAVELQLGR